MPRTSATATRTRPVATGTVNGATGAADRIDTDSLWEYQQVTANYRFLRASNPLGFVMQMQSVDEYGHFGAWKGVDAIPAFVIKPLLIQCGLLSPETGTIGSSRSAPIPRSGTLPKTASVSHV